MMERALEHALIVGEHPLQASLVNEDANWLGGFFAHHHHSQDLLLCLWMPFARIGRQREIWAVVSLVRSLIDVLVSNL
jgi:hypothetical protein